MYCMTIFRLMIVVTCIITNVVRICILSMGRNQYLLLYVTCVFGFRECTVAFACMLVFLHVPICRCMADDTERATRGKAAAAENGNI